MKKFTQIGIFGLKINHLATLTERCAARLPDGIFTHQKSVLGKILEDPWDEKCLICFLPFGTF
jgi:hypothetical protein